MQQTQIGINGVKVNMPEPKTLMGNLIRETGAELQPGDIFRIPSSGIFGWASKKLLSPHTEYYHHGLLWMPLGEDWITIENTTEDGGVDVRMLSWNMLKPGDKISVLRVDAPLYLRQNAPKHLVPYSRAKYGYWQIARILLEAIGIFAKMLVVEHKLRKLTAEDFTNYLNEEAFVCTSAVEIAYLAAGLPVVNPEHPALPSAFEQSIINGLLSEVAILVYPENSRKT